MRSHGIRDFAAAAFRLSPGVVVPGTRFEITGWLGEGGMGTVYEATHVDLGRRVAIKVLHPELSADPEQAELFREEARAATRVGSPWIVHVEDFEQLPDGRLVYIMELFEGGRLYDEVAGHPMPPGRLIGILRQLCKGLAAAHAQRIIHRDVKPENIALVANAEHPDTIKIMDFGIATMLGGKPQISGTPYYMAPEQIVGAGFSGRVDVYSVGCVAYELLTGSPPFAGGTVKEVLRHQLKTPPTPPNDFAGTQVVPPPLERVVLRCLAKTARDRYPNMAELEAAVCEAQIEIGIPSAWDHLPPPDVDPERRATIAAGFPIASSTPEQRPRRRPMIVAAGLAAALAATVSFFVFGGDSGLDAAAADEIEIAAAHARAAAARAYYVYPPPSSPEEPTAYGIVLELEAEDGDLAEPARERASALRAEFANTLVYLGDQYWDRPGGKSFAIDYYAQALLFEPDNGRAADRGSLTPGQLATLQRKAERQAFSTTELAAAEPLLALAEPDQGKRDEKLGKVIDASRGRSLRADAELETLMGSLRSSKSNKRKGARGTNASTTPKPTPPTRSAEAALAGVAGPLSPGVIESGSAQTKNRPVDRKKASGIAKEGYRSLRASRLSDAERSFHNALAYDARCGRALIGLSDVHFERGQYDRAVQFARRAVTAFPKRRSYRVKLGDAYYKVLKYADAREQYSKAKRLGDARAGQRLKRLDAIAGG